MNVPLSQKKNGLFTIWAILVTHDELCLSKFQNSIFDRSHESGSATWPPRSKTLHQGGGGGGGGAELE
jgi:hypothetical protein